MGEEGGVWLDQAHLLGEEDVVEQALQAPQAGALALGQGVGGRAERKPAVQGAQRGQRVVVERDGLGMSAANRRPSAAGDAARPYFSRA